MDSIDSSTELSNLSNMRRYSLAELDAIDFSTSDDFAVVVENMKKLIILKTEAEELWNEEHEQNLWQFAIDPESLIILFYIIEEKLYSSFDIPSIPIGELFYFIKTSSDKLLSKHYDQKIMYGIAKAPYFESLYKLLHKVYFPIFVENTDWSKCIKTDYLQQQSKFLSQIFDLRNELIGELMFYVPKDILVHSVDIIPEDKEPLNEVERIAMNWIWQLMSMLMKRSSNEAGEKCGPIEEIEFWKGKYFVLQKAVCQLDRDDVRKCIEVLKIGKSGCLSKIIAVKAQLLDEANTASENIKFLSILKKPCDLIQSASLMDMSKYLSGLLNSVKIIWNNSLYFNNDSEISNLLSKVNNFVIYTCSQHIPLDSIFCKEDFEQDDVILDVIYNCNEWINIFNISENSHKKFSTKCWSVESVASLMSLFIHRCEELIKVSEFKKQFKCNFQSDNYVKGHKCFEIAEQFEVIESYFWHLLENLKKYQKSCLDIYTTIWYDHFKKFKIEVLDLEVTVTKLMSNAFNNFTGINEGIQILEMFKKYFEKEVIKRDLRKCVKSLYDVFFNEVNFVKKKLLESKMMGNPLLPNYGGTAFCIHLLPKKLKQQYKHLKSAANLWPEEFIVHIDDQYQQVLEAVNESAHTLFLQWIKTIPKDPYSWLRQTMISKKESSHFIQMNVESNIIILIEELYYWEKTGVEIPHQVVKLHEKSDIYSKRIFRAIQCVKSYNRIISSLILNGNEEIFKETLSSLEANVLPSLLDLDWSSPQATLNATMRIFAEQIKSANDTFSHYEDSNAKISQICNKIGKICLFSCDVKSPMQFEDFIEMQETFKKSGVKEVHGLCLEILSVAKKVQSVYKKKKPDDEQFISKHVEVVAKYISDSLAETFLSSLKVIASLFGIDRKNKMKMILKVSLTLDKNKLAFKPTFKEVCSGIDDLIENIASGLSCVLKSEDFFENFNMENNFRNSVDYSELIKETRKNIDYGLSKLHEAQNSYIDEWKPFSHLWVSDKTSILSKYQAEGWKASCFESDVNEFLHIASKIALIQRYKSLDYCISDCSLLKESAVACSEKWKNELGSIFTSISKSNLQNAYDLIEFTIEKFLNIPKTLDELKYSLKFLINSKVCSLRVKSTFQSIHEIFSVLKKFAIPINEKFLDQEKHLEKNWKKLESNFIDYYVELQRVQAIHQRHVLQFHDKLQQQAYILQEDLHTNGPFQSQYDFSDAMHKIVLFKSILTDHKKKESCMKRDAKFFNLFLEPLETLKSVENELHHLRIAWMYAKQIEDYIFGWRSIALLHFDVQEKKIISDNFKQLTEDLKERVQGKHWILLDELFSKLTDLEEYYAIILNFQEPTLQERHWNEMKNILELPPDEAIEFFQSSEFSFKFLQGLEIKNLLEKTSMIAMQAKKEYEIEQTLKRMEDIWKTVAFDMSDYKDFYKLEDTRNIVSLIQDHQTILGRMKASKYVSYFSSEIDSLENSLCLILDVIEQAEFFQSKFFFLENMFAEQTVQAQLPKESVEFEELTLQWKDIAVLINSEKYAWKISHEPDFLQTLVEMNEKIQYVQKSLESFLESKRRAFPRFYFLSDDDLLSIIGQSSPKAIQQHLKKIFDGIDHLEIKDVIEEKMRQKEILIMAYGMHSKCKEHVEFLDPIHLAGPVESWLLDIEDMMHSTLSGLLPKCLQVLLTNLIKEDFDFTEIKWLYNWPGQICLLSLQVAWTAEVTAAIKAVQENAVIVPLKNLKKKWREILNQFIQKLGKKYEALMQLKCIMLITTLVHMCDIIDTLIKYVCNDPSAFEWLVQLRYFYDDDEEKCQIQQAKAVLKYGFEYLDNRERIVITPLTERCFVSITTAFMLHQGALIKGHKSSGKTETLRELGKTVGNYVLIINCSEGLTHLSLTRMLSGLAQIGAWGLFEEFNNVNIEIMSVLSQQISVIFQALALENDYFSFMGQEIFLQRRCGIFLSINHVCSVSNYNLPTALSNLFRPVIMMSPDIERIIEVYFFAYEFRESKILSKDVHLIFKLAEDQLSAQHHYDFGLCTVISFLKYLGNLKRTSSGASDTDVIATSLERTVLPKLLLEDIPIFETLLDSILGSVKSISKDIFNIKDTIIKVLRENSLQTTVSSIAKIIEFHEMRKLYHAIILLGESGSGKTTTWKTLKEVYSDLQTADEKMEVKTAAVHTYMLNPKAFSIQELFGYFNSKGDWIDGLFTSVLRGACSNVRANDKWIVLSGPIDTLWTENISSVLDSTKVLTLANGERILLSKEIYFIIETTDLLHCSPGAVSQCGIIYHHSNNVGWEAYFHSWLEKIEFKKFSSVIGDLAERYLDVLFEFYSKSLEGSKIIFRSNISCITSFCKIMDTLVQRVIGEKGLADKLSRIFWVSVTWSLGSVLDARGQHLFNDFVHSLHGSLPGPGSIFDHGLNDSLEWIKWSNILPSNWKLEKGVQSEAIMVPTKTATAYQFIIENLLKAMNPIFLIGEAGSGKTMIAQNLLNNLSSENYKYTTMNISCQTTSKKIQQTVETQMVKKAGNVYLPEDGQKLIIFLDDLNLAHCTKFETVPYLELINMLLDYKYWYNRETWKTNHIQNSVFLCAMSPQGSGQKHPTQPFLSHFNVINIIPATDAELKYIFISLLKDKFSDPNTDMRRLINAISLGSFYVYKAVTKLFLPTPSKLHYLFSMHNIKKVILRLFEVNPEHLSDRMIMTKFWFHECLREFSDKLISEEDRMSFFQNLCEIVGNQFLVQLSSMNVENTPPIFAKFLNPAQGYEEVRSLHIFKKHIEKIIENYERIHSSAPVVLFDNALEHLCRIIRGIEMHYGNMLLVGISGTGRQALSRTAAFILNYEVYEIQLKKHYGIHEFRYDLQKLLYMCGVKKKNVLFLLSDSQIVNDEFLQCITEILNFGEIADLYRQNELSQIYGEIMEMSDMNLEIDAYHSIFVENVKKHLHLVFCVSYGTSFYKNCILNYPAICKCTTADWFDDWPKEALEYVAIKFIRNFNLGHSAQSLICCEILSEIHESAVKLSKERKRSSVKMFHFSSTFITLVKTFKNVFTKKCEEVQKAMERLESGLLKIHETQEMVNEIAKKTEEAREEFIISEKECDEALLGIQAKKAIAAETQEDIQVKKTEIEKNEKICKKIAIAAQEDLNAALPTLEDARKALEALNKKHIGEVKSYTKPPVLVEMVLEAVMILRDSEPSWAEAKRQLGSPSFLKELSEYDRDNISDSALMKVGKYVTRQEFQPEIIGKVSAAAKSLCIWVRAMHLYGEIYKKVKPKKERLRKAQEELQKLQINLAALLKELEELTAAILQMEREHALLLKKKEEYAANARLLALKLERANNIIQGLSSEKERWNNKYLALAEKRKFVIGDSFMAAGYVTYLGPYDPYFRMRTYSIWKRKITNKNFLCSPEFDLAEFFMDDTVLTKWNICGLPTDQYSYEGAAIINESYCCPFIIDPEGQAVKWIKNMGSKQGLKFCDLQDSKWVSIVESAIVNGFPVLLHSMNAQLDSLLEPLFNKFNEASTVNFNNKELILHKAFRLYISTQAPNPVFSQAVLKQICIINFTIKEKGLEDQLLPLVVQKERSDLEITKEKLVKSIRKSKTQLLDLEDTILKLLKEAKGSLLEDELLVEALNKSKTLSIEVEDKLVSNEKTEMVIDSAREKYRPAAKHAAILYFVLSDMTSVDSIYVFNLDSYINLFLDSIDKSPADMDITRRILKLKLYHQYAVFKFACRTVSEKHSLLLSFHMCSKILKNEGSLDKDEYDFFIYGSRALDPASEPPNPCSQWLPQKCWEHVTQLEKLPKFIGITVSFDEISRNWQEWYQTGEPEKIFLPGNWRNTCNEFEKLLIIRCLRVDRISSCIRSFVQNNFGKLYLEYPHMSLTDVIKESNSSKPLVLFILSSDIDIEVVVSNLACRFGMLEKYRAVSLGQGQGLVATQLIIDAAKLGYWAFIFNCHLVLTWLPDLEKIVNKLSTIKAHPEFRLFLCSSPIDSFPTSILQNSSVVTVDAPKGIRNNMLKLYRTDAVKNCDLKRNQIKYRNLLFSLAFLHSVLIERKKFQNLGWNADYSFTDADFKVSERMLQIYFSEYSDTPWDAFKNSIADVCYKNHITDERDDRLLMTYYEQCFCDEACSNIKYPLSTLDTYYVPEDGPFESYIKYIQSLPLVDKAEVFGQHANAEIPYRIQEGESLLKLMSKIRDTFFQKETLDIQILKIIENLQQEVPNEIDEEASLSILQEKPEPVSFVLVQETKRYNVLLNTVKQTLDDLEESINGKRKMTEETEEFLMYIRKMEVPKPWQLAYPSLKPLGSWIQDVKLRVQQFQDWSSTGITPIKFWLPGFTSPRSLLNAALLTTVKNSDRKNAEYTSKG